MQLSIISVILTAMENNFNRNWWLYVLELEQGKYYVGITSQTPEIRMQEHINHVRSAYWTMKYKPTKIIYKQQLGVISKTEAEEFENKKIRELIKVYGTNNVRGGDIKMTEDIIRRFGYFLKMDEWEGITIMILLILGNLFWIIMYYLK